MLKQVEEDPSEQGRLVGRLEAAPKSSTGGVLVLLWDGDGCGLSATIAVKHPYRESALAQECVAYQS